MRKRRVFALFLSLALLLCTLPASAEEGDGWLVPKVREAPAFTDMAGVWCADAVDTVCQAGLMQGRSDGSFGPSGQLTGAHIATICARLHDLLTGGDGALPEPAEGQEWYDPAYASLSQALDRLGAAGGTPTALEAALQEELAQGQGPHALEEPPTPEPEAPEVPEPAPADVPEASAPDGEAPAQPVPPPEEVPPEPEPAPAPVPPQEAPAPVQEPPAPVQEEAPPEPGVLPDGAQLINVMERLVDEKLERYVRMFHLCECPRCLADAKALALTRLPAKYVVLSASARVPMLSLYQAKFDSDVTTQIIYACKEVMERPRHAGG